MDLAWYGIGGGFMGGNFGNSAPYSMEISELTDSIYVEATEFMNKLTTVGTLFRFKNDPRALEDSLYQLF